MTGLVYDDCFLEHDTGQGHPERPDRLRAIVTALKEANIWSRLNPIPFEPANLETIRRVHDQSYIDRLKAACESGMPFIDVGDSTICPASYDIALRAAGGILAAVDHVIAGHSQNTVCLIRPPGHHAERDRSMGFCLFNNVAVAAEHLIHHHRLDRVAIMDFDVHHGNGTQHSFEERNDILFVSTHEDPAHLYPGTGYKIETGKGMGEGFTLNIAMTPGGGDDEYQRVFEDQVLPRLNDFQPQFLLISAGFDAADQDPLAHMQMTPDGFTWIARELKQIAAKHCNGRYVATLEGGYDLQRLSESVVAMVEIMMESS